MQKSNKIIENLCRLCGEESTEGIDIFTDTTENWMNHIKSLPFHIEEDSKYPRKMCYSCRLNLEIMVQFFKIIRRGQNRLEEMVLHLKNVPEEVDLEDPKVVMAETRKPGFICDICRKNFKRKDAIRVHMRKHTKDFPFCCRVCQKAFNQIGHLKDHERTHTLEFPFKCGACGLAFKSSSHLNRHRKQHHGNFKCPRCNETFTEFIDLKKHKKQHTQEMRFECDVCKKTFNKNHVMKRHRNLHEEKKFFCEICRRHFADPSNLTRHRKIHSRIKMKELDDETESSMGSEFSYRLDDDEKRRIREKLLAMCNDEMDGEEMVYIVVKDDQKDYETAEVEEISSRIKGLERELRFPVIDDTLPID